MSPSEICFPASLLLIMTPGKVLVVVCGLCFLASDVNAAKRSKLELRFPKGTSIVLAVSLVNFLPKGPTDGFAHILEFDLGFPFPEQAQIGQKPPEKKASKPPQMMKHKTWYQPTKRMKRNSKDDQRKNLLLKLQDGLNRIGFDGFSCISRFLCELRGISPENSLLEQILSALFKPFSKPTEQQCERHRKNCQVSILQIIMHSEETSP